MTLADLPFTKILGFDVVNTPFDNVLNEVFPSNRSRVVINTISPNSFGIATKDAVFHRALSNSILVLDGVYFVLASLIKVGGNVIPNQGPHITKSALEHANSNRMKVFFLGSTPETLSKISDHLKKTYPDITAEFYSPPFKDELTADDNRPIHEKINAFRPDLLLIGMTCHKQEKWIHANREYIQFGLSMSVGAVFDWLAGNYTEIAPIWWRLRLGWLVRAIQRPNLLKRNTPNYWIFFKHMAKSLWN
jgi:N-acetylglucosaminyldiphosphoundecaprenol N-acetyl-beta-D-mannosaminyltransferase